MPVDRYVLVELPFSVQLTDGGRAISNSDAERIQHVLLSSHAMVGALSAPTPAPGPGARAASAAAPLAKFLDKEEFNPAPMPRIPFSPFVRLTESAGDEATRAPALLASVNYCHHLMVDVTTRRRKRGREAPEHQTAEAEAPTITAVAVRGIVSRDLSLPLPADFVFSRSAPEAEYRTRVFPPAAFLPHNNAHVPSVVPYFFQDPPTDGRQGRSAVVGQRFRTVPVSPWPLTDAGVPAAPPPEHASELARLTEVEQQTLAEMAAAMPVATPASYDKYLRLSGRWTRWDMARRGKWGHFYSIIRGPFQRSYVRYGVNPASDPALRFFQRIAVRVQPTSALGILLHDLSHTPGIKGILADAMAESLAARAQASADDGPDISPEAAAAIRWYSAKEECFATVMEMGKIFFIISVADLLSDRDFAAMACAARVNRECDAVSGWFSRHTIDQFVVYIIEDLLRWGNAFVVPRTTARAAAAAAGAPLQQGLADGATPDESDGSAAAEESDEEAEYGSSDADDSFAGDENSISTGESPEDYSEVTG